MSKLRWGICSAGKISSDFAHGLALSDLTKENHKIQAVGARKKEDAEKLAKSVGAETAYGSYDQLAADPNVDIIYIGAINNKHASLSKLFLEAKKHVLCEKPLGMHAGEVEEIVAAAKANGRFVMEAIWSRFLPSFEKVRSLIAAGEIGDVKYITGDFCFPGVHIPRLFEKELGGGAIVDVGIYLIQLATMILGPEPELIQGVGGLTDTGVDEICSMTLRYPGNRVCSMVTGLSAFGNNEATIFGTKGRIKLHGAFHCSSTIELMRGYPAPGMFESQTIECPMLEVDHKFNFVNSNGLAYEAEACRKAIEEGKTEHPLMPLSESLVICRIMDKLRHDLGYYRSDEEVPAKA